MNFILEVIGIILVTCFLIASCTDEGLKVNVNGMPYCVKVGGENIETRCEKKE